MADLGPMFGEYPDGLALLREYERPLLRGPTPDEVYVALDVIEWAMRYDPTNHRVRNVLNRAWGMVASTSDDAEGK